MKGAKLLMHSLYQKRDCASCNENGYQYMIIFFLMPFLDPILLQVDHQFDGVDQTFLNVHNTEISWCFPDAKELIYISIFPVDQLTAAFLAISLQIQDLSRRLLI